MIPSIEQLYGVQLYVKEDYKCHPIISGNKYRKLKGNLKIYNSGSYKGILSFGGAHSNHLFALAGVSKCFGIPVTMIVRGDGYDEMNDTLRFAKQSGVELIFTDRQSYREKDNNSSIAQIMSRFYGYLVIPEGGSNEFAMEGLKELYEEIASEDVVFDVIALSMGTGGTAAGILQASQKERIVVYPALKGEWMKEHIKESWKINIGASERLDLRTDHHFGGYGKVNDKLLSFIVDCKEQFGLPLDRVYTSKAFYGIIQDIINGYYPVQSKILFLHTGGLRP